MGKEISTADAGGLSVDNRYRTTLNYRDRLSGRVAATERSAAEEEARARGRR